MSFGEHNSTPNACLLGSGGACLRGLVCYCVFGGKEHLLTRAQTSGFRLLGDTVMKVMMKVVVAGVSPAAWGCHQDPRISCVPPPSLACYLCLPVGSQGSRWLGSVFKVAGEVGTLVSATPVPFYWERTSFPRSTGATTSVRLIGLSFAATPGRERR